MKYVLYPIIFLAALSASGCCRCPYEVPTPSKVDGWKESYVGSTRFIADLLLKTGESSDSGKVGIRVASIDEGSCACLPLAEPTEHTVKLQFYDPGTKEVRCEQTFRIGSAFLRCDQVDVFVVGVVSINPREQMIHVKLIG